jgi:steroid 5-alpha reductase family enzyme
MYAINIVMGIIEKQTMFLYTFCMKRFLLFIVLALCLSVIIMLPFAGGLSGFPAFIASANALLVIALWALGFSVCSYIFGIVTGDYSWVDRLWSTLPVAFVWYYAYRGGFSPALCAVAVLVTVWGIRLSLNFARKGGYSGTEDYRWIILRERIRNPFLWQLFSLLFISFYQIGLFVLFTYPVYSIAALTEGKASALFWVFAALGLAFICFETVADQQQWVFHAAKKAAAAKQNYPLAHLADVQRGFLSRGLFSLSRHPNYFGELGFWWSIWLMALSLIGDVILSGGFGPVMLTLLFIGSTIFTEGITSAKYPGYKDYQSRVSPIIPWFPRKK